MDTVPPGAGRLASAQLQPLHPLRSCGARSFVASSKNRRSLLTPFAPRRLNLSLRGLRLSQPVSTRFGAKSLGRLAHFVRKTTFVSQHYFFIAQASPSLSKNLLRPSLRSGLRNRVGFLRLRSCPPLPHFVRQRPACFCSLTFVVHKTSAFGLLPLSVSPKAWGSCSGVWHPLTFLVAHRKTLPKMSRVGQAARFPRLRRGRQKNGDLNFSVFLAKPRLPIMTSL